MRLMRLFLMALLFVAGSNSFSCSLPAGCATMPDCGVASPASCCACCIETAETPSHLDTAPAVVSNWIINDSCTTQALSQPQAGSRSAVVLVSQPLSAAEVLLSRHRGRSPPALA